VNDDNPVNAASEFEKSLQRPPPLAQYVLHLFVTGMTPRSASAIENLKRVCEQHLEGRYTLEVTDIYQHPELAREVQLVAAPTLIKELPLPLRRIIGDLSDREKVLVGLDLKKRS
jgi:circadian clock protein KaiB